MDFESLPYVAVAQNGKIEDTWRVVSTGDYGEDCSLGRKYFRLLQMLMVVTGNSTLLFRVSQGQAAKFATWGGIEAGFHFGMGEELSISP